MSSVGDGARKTIYLPNFGKSRFSGKQSHSTFNFNIHPNSKEKTVVDNYNTIILMLNGATTVKIEICKSIVVPGHILLTILNSVGLLQKQNINIQQFKTIVM